METITVKMLVSRGNPQGGAIIRKGVVVALPAFWAKRFIADGTAVEETDSAKPKAKGKKNEES